MNRSVSFVSMSCRRCVFVGPNILVNGGPARTKAIAPYIRLRPFDLKLDVGDALKADHIVMENAHRPPEELAVFKDLRKEIGFGLGVVDIKRTEIESPEQIARAIERAEKMLGRERVQYIHPDCGFWMLKRNIADGKIRALVKGRDLYEGRSG